jgi:hypothetical protein
MSRAQLRTGCWAAGLALLALALGSPTAAPAQKDSKAPADRGARGEAPAHPGGKPADGILGLLPAGPDAGRVVKWLDPLRYRDAVAGTVTHARHVEAVEMLTAIWSGSDMGPGDGWFHPGESRYGWKWLAGRLDTDRDGRITRQEFRGPAELFDRLDRDRDGVLTPEDFDWSERSAFLRQAGIADRLFRMMDHNSNGRVSRAEWEAFFEKMAKDRDFITPDDLRDAAFPPSPAPPPGKAPPGMPSPLLLTLGLLRGEIGSPFEGPSLGQKAPDFTLPREDGKGEINLAKFQGHKPVVLIFGSFT